MTVCRIAYVLILVCSAVAFTACQRGDTVDLKLNLEEGRSYRYTFDYEITQKAAGQRAVTNLVVVFDVNVLQRTDSLHEMEAVYRRISMNVASGGDTAGIDTEKPPGPTDMYTNPMHVYGVAFQEIIGHRMFIAANARGELVSVTGFDNIAQYLIDSLSLDEETRFDLVESLEQQFGDVSTRRHFEQVFNIFPHHGVRKGNTWSKDVITEAPMLGGITSRNVYTLRNADGATAQLDLKSDVSTGTGDLFGMQTGSFAVDMPSGLVIHANVRQDFRGKPQEQEVELTSVCTVIGIER